MKNFFNSTEVGSNGGGGSNEEIIDVGDTKSTVDKIIENSGEKKEAPEPVKCPKCGWLHEPGKSCAC